MKKRKDPPGYPGDEAIRKAFGETLRELRLQKGWSLEEADAMLQDAFQEDPDPLLARALGLVVRQLREKQKMSRVQLSAASSLPVRFISNLERGKVQNATLTQIVRISMALNHSIVDLVNQVEIRERQLKIK